MEIQEILDNLELAEMAFQINEMAIYYGTDHGVVDNVQQAYKQLLNKQEGMYHTKQFLRVLHTVTQRDINNGLYKPVQLDIDVEILYPIIIVWGEPDKTKGMKHLQGHGLVHILQGHSKQAGDCFNALNKFVGTQIAKRDKYGNYTIRNGAYRFTFMLQNNENGTPKHAVLITAFKR